jgi:hypothetical protein
LVISFFLIPLSLCKDHQDQEGDGDNVKNDDQYTNKTITTKRNIEVNNNNEYETTTMKPTKQS